MTAGALFSELTGANQPPTTSQHSQTIHDCYNINLDVADDIGGSGRCFN